MFTGDISAQSGVLSHTNRTYLEPPERMRSLTVDPDRPHFHVPWFVAWIDNKPDYRVIDAGKLVSAVKNKVCWLCGKRLGSLYTFLLGPMCCITRTVSEPGCHLECAEYAVKICPFLTHPKMVRNSKDLPEEIESAAGFGLKRNPGCIATWTTKSFKCFYANRGEKGILFTVGDPYSVSWWAEGRKATRAEVQESIDSGLPSLIEMVEMEKPEKREAARAELDRMTANAMSLLPGGE